MTFLIHPGFHKTGTSWLQERLFAHEKNFNAILSHQEVDDLIVRPHDFRFDGKLAQSVIAARSSRPAGTIDVISSEILVGNPAFGSRDAVILAERLRAIVDDGKILLTIRNQAAMIRSVYQQYVKRGGALDMERFLDRRCEPGYFGFDPDMFLFHTYAELYERLFGQGNVLVLPQELLADDPAKFVGELFGFLGRADQEPEWLTGAAQKVGQSPPAGATDILRFANLWRPSPYQPGGIRRTEPLARLLLRAAYRMKWGSADQLRRWNASIAPLLIHYRDSNRALQRFCPVDLESFGYV